MATDDFVVQLKGRNPFPWRQIIHPNGVVQIIDAGGKEVPLFTITEFACFITNVMNKPQKEAA